MSRAVALWLAGAGLFVLALTLNLRAIPTAPFHPDETRWLNRAHYLADLGHPGGQTWADGYLTRGQPPLGSYLTGLGLLLQGRDLTTNGVWDFHHDAAWNTARGSMADPLDLTAGRRTNAVVGAGAAVLLLLAVTRLTSLPGGVLAGLALATHPLMIRLSSQALADALLVALLAGALLATTWLARRPGRRSALAVGVLLGLAGATKLSPLLLTLPLALLGATLWATAARATAAPGDSGRHQRRLGLALLATPLIAAATFVASYPYLWRDPIGRTLALFTFRAEEMARQGSNWPAVAVESRIDALARIGQRLIVEFSGSGQLWPMARGLDLALGLAGMALLAVVGLRRWRDARWLCAATLLLSQSVLIVLGLRSDYARYHLPLVLAIATGIGVLAGEVTTWLRSRPGRTPQWVLAAMLAWGYRHGPALGRLAVVGVVLGGAGALTSLHAARGAGPPRAALATPVAATDTPVVGAAATPLAGTAPVGLATPMALATPVPLATPLGAATLVADASSATPVGN